MCPIAQIGFGTLFEINSVLLERQAMNGLSISVIAYISVTTTLTRTFTSQILLFLFYPKRVTSNSIGPVTFN